MQLIYYSNIYLNPGVVEKEIMDETSLALRTLSGKLRALNHAIRCYGFWELMKIVPKRNDVIQASKELILLSNSVYRSEYLNQNIDTEKRIKELLNINL